jgi:hypothetical protein
MSITYLCRHCGTKIGEINHASVTETQLGFQFLTPEERSDIISYNVNGAVTVKVVCEYCNQALEANPELLLVVNPLQ